MNLILPLPEILLELMHMKTSPRSLKLSSLIQEQLPLILQKMFTPEEIGFVTVTAVEGSGDLGLVDVFVSSFQAPSDFLETLQKSAKKICFELLKIIKLRREFTLRFKLDKSSEHVAKLSQLLDKNL